MGSPVADDGCSDVTCQVEVGWTCSGLENSTCDEICGDGILVGVEACDDDNTDSGDGCSSACTEELGWTCAGEPSACVTTCGDGLTAGTEQCDQGDGTGGDVAPNNGDGTSTCTATCQETVCGDGYTSAGVPEACDDGNTDAGDGCSPTCAEEFGYGCSEDGNFTSSCASTCGDGQKASDEACDNDVGTPPSGGDGCSAVCGVEAGWTCTGTDPSSCATTCGDGVRAGDEVCDDGDSDDTNGCSNSCANHNTNSSPDPCALY